MMTLLPTKLTVASVLAERHRVDARTGIEQTAPKLSSPTAMKRR
jgi:hypothetical protein